MSTHTYDEDVQHISKIQFSIFTNDDIFDYSSVKKDENGITLPESYENSEPKRGGLVDTRLGITDRNLECAYCGLSDINCQGHFGHMKLVSPVFNYAFFNVAKQILSCICLRSARLLIHTNPKERDNIVKLYKGKKRFAEIKKISSTITHSDVGVPVPKIKEERKNKGCLILVAETVLSSVVNEDGTVTQGKILREELNALDVYNIFRNITDEDFEILGFNVKLFRPDDLLIKNFPFPPLAIRPSLRAYYLNTQIFEDDLTHQLSNIVKFNEKYRQQKEKELLSGEESKFGKDLSNYLQCAIINYFDNDKKNAFPQTELRVGGKKFKSISERIKGKKGRIRQNIQGKRVNFSARSVITSDPSLKLNELGIPKKIAMNITFPEVVTSHNISYLTKLVNNGRYIYPGANMVKQGSSLNSSEVREFDLRYRKKSIKLKYGDIVERHLTNGDPVLFNRQPSLHKLSMMCHRAKIIDDDRFNTFRLNVNTTPPYNADFDGDEMNLFAPQSIQTQTELALIADVNKLIISPKDSQPIIAPVQDSVIGSYNMTRDDVRVDWHDMMNIIVRAVNLDYSKINIEKNKVYRGKDLYNMIIPEEVNLNSDVVIKNGNIVEGIVKKKENKKIIINCWDKYGPKVTADYITNIQKLCINWMLYDGFTVGFGDCIIDKKVTDEISLNLEKKKLEISHKITEIENNPELLDGDLFEFEIKNNLIAFKGDIQKKVVENLSDTNNFHVMSIGSGAKGNDINLSQIMAALGQDIFKQKRIEKEMNNRSLVHFHQNDDTLKARGFISNSYLSGLDAHEFFFHHMTGREGLIDTAIKTAETGYLARKIMKLLEDIGLKYDNTVRTGNGMILQYIYSDFNLDQIKQKKSKLNTIKMGNKELVDNYGLSKSEIKSLSKKFKMSEKDLVKLDKDFLVYLLISRDMMRENQRVINMNYKTLVTEFYFPINLNRIIFDELNTERKNDNGEMCDPKYIIDRINYVLKPDITRLMSFNKKMLSDKNSLKLKDEQESKKLFKYYLYENLSPKKVIFVHKLTKLKFDMIIEQIIKDFKLSQVHPGEMVGCLAAQHIGEPSTQMNLNTFHSTGSGSSAMEGVPRVEELTRATKNIKTPEMIIYLKDEYNNKEQASIIASNIKNTIINDVILSYEMIYDDDTENVGYTKKDNVSNPFFVNTKSDFRDIKLMKWLLRIKLDRNKLNEKNVTTLDIKTNYKKLHKSYDMEGKTLKRNEKKILSSINSSCILSTKDNVDEPIVHIRFDINNFNYELLLLISDWLINNFKLKGIDEIMDARLDTGSMLLSFNNENNEVIEKSEIVIYTSGINIEDVRYIKGIDLVRTYCNEINTINKQFGIEAARSALLTEFSNVFNDINVNYHHLVILVDVMTNLGFITSIDRHGVNKLDTDPLSRASFEMAVEQLIKAAVFSEVDHLRSVSSRIAAGRVISGGTGLSSLIIDSNFVMNSEYIEDDDPMKRTDFKTFNESLVIKDILNRSSFNIFKPII